MPRAALSVDAVVDVALQLIDEGGAGAAAGGAAAGAGGVEGGPVALTLSAVAARAGVATPSLYKHVRNLAELRDLLSARIMNEMADEVGAAVLGRSSDEAVRALMTAWRAYARRHPRRYAALVQRPEPRTAEAGARLIGIMLATLRAYGLEDSAAIHAARCLRAVVHGFAELETGGAFELPEKLDETYDLLVHMVVSGLHAPRE